MSEKKEYLSFVHVFRGPRETDHVELLATDASAGTSIYAHEFVKLDNSWDRAIERLKAYVDPRTIEILKAKVEDIRTMLREQKGSIWVKPEGVIVR